MTAAEFRRIALSFPGCHRKLAYESSRIFASAARYFATLGAPDKGWGMVKLWPDEQATFMEAEPKVFVPAAGAWGRRAPLTSSSPRQKETLARAHRRLAQHRTQTPGRPAQSRRLEQREKDGFLGNRSRIAEATRTPLA